MPRELAYLNALRALESSARLGSFARAAEELGVTPAAVGQQVRVLEDYLGRKLFRRHGQSCQRVRIRSASASSTEKRWGQEKRL